MSEYTDAHDAVMRPVYEAVRAALAVTDAAAISVDVERYLESLQVCPECGGELEREGIHALGACEANRRAETLRSALRRILDAASDVEIDAQTIVVEVQAIAHTALSGQRDATA